MKKYSTIDRIKKLFLKLSHSPEYIYLLIALIGVIGFAILTPPFQGPDEEAHYIRVQYIAHGYVVPVSTSDSSVSLPKSIEKVLKSTFYNDDLRGKTADKYELYRTKSVLKMHLNSQDSYKPSMINYSALPYLPAVPGVFLSNILNLSPLISMYIARISLGIVSIVIMFFSIKLIPRKKYLLVTVGLIPMLLFQQAMVTIDSISYALLTLFVAFVLYLYNSKNINKAQWVKLGIISLILVLVKPLVWLFLPLVFILIKKKNSIRWLVAITTVCVILLASSTILSGMVSGGSSGSVPPKNTNASLQKQLILSNPLRVLRVGWNSYMTTYGDDEVRGVIGIFGAADTAYPLWMYTGYVLLLGLVAAVDLDEKKSKRISRGWKVLVLMLSVGYFLAVNLALYLSYTPVNFDIVYGVQGRYFLPIMIVGAAMLSVAGLKIKSLDVSKVKALLIIAAFFLVVLAVFTVLQRYYLYTP